MSGAEPRVAGAAREPSGEDLHALIRELYPICRSISGRGVRETLAILRRLVPLDVHEVASGTQVFDWVVPNEWNIAGAYIKDPEGKKVVDFADHNLHIMSYSKPVRATMTLAELRPHLHSLPDHPDRIPYRTSYYREDWGFCLSHRVLSQLRDGRYEVVIDSTLEPGSLSYGELHVPGAIEDEILIFTHTCHPSLCNDNLSGLAITAKLAASIAGEKRRHSYRFVWAPGTIGSICWLSRNEHNVQRIAHGLVLALVGDRGPLTYKRSRRGDAVVDRAAEHVLTLHSDSARVIDFSPYGYDERQFCSPGFNLPVGRLTRTPNGEYPEYHSSADDLSFVTPETLLDSYTACRKLLDVLDGDGIYVSQAPKCEPQLGKRGLYRQTGGKDLPDRELSLLWVLNQSDGEHSLLDVAIRSGLPFASIRSAADELIAARLLREGEQ
jgi:aminopeptidase-like protein